MGDEKETVIWAHCNKCSQQTKHAVLKETSIRVYAPGQLFVSIDENSDWCDITYSFLQCLGCDDASLKRSVYASAVDEIVEEEFYPPRVSRKIPEWFAQLPQEYFPLLNEVYSSLQSGNRILAMMGTRTLLDIFIRRKVGESNNFKVGLNALVDKNYLAALNRPVIESAIEAGHAAAHRAYLPSPEELNAVVDIVENLIQHEILLNSAHALREAIPQRGSKKQGSE